MAGADNGGLITIIDQTGTNNGTLTNFTLIGTASNYVTQFSSLVVLPPRWLSFAGKLKETKILLEWSTAAEQFTRDFFIEHSIVSICMYIADTDSMNYKDSFIPGRSLQSAIPRL